MFVKIKMCPDNKCYGVILSHSRIHELVLELKTRFIKKTPILNDFNDQSALFVLYPYLGYFDNRDSGTRNH